MTRSIGLYDVETVIPSGGQRGRARMMLQNQRVAGIRRAALAVMAVAAMFVVAACGGASSLSPGSHAASVYTGGAPGGTPVHGGTATVDSAEAPASLDPITINAPGTINPSVAIFDTLVELV